MALGIIGIVVALCIFLYGAYKNVSTLYLAPIAGIIVAVTNGINATKAFTEYYIGIVEPAVAQPGVWEIGGVAGMILKVFPTIFLGALFGKVLTDCGAANSMSTFLTQKFVLSLSDKERQAKRAVLIMLLLGCILTYGGVDGFVAVFALFPVTLVMAEKIGIPRRFIPAMLCLNCGAMSAPFVLSINNIMCMMILQTSPGAAAIPGFITFFVIEIGVYFICSRMIVSAMRKGEKFELGGCPQLSGAPGQKGPSFIVALLPLILVFILFAVMQNASLALTAGILLAIILMSQYFPSNGTESNVGAWVGKIVDSLNSGAINGAQALMTITAAAGFAGVVQHTEAFNGFVGILLGLKTSPMIIAIVLIIVIVAFTSSPPAALGIALPIIAMNYVAAGAINPDALARVSAIAVSTFETLPVNGLIILTTSLAQVKIKDAYLPMFLQTVIMTLVGTILCSVLIALFPGIV